jgi:hypothetical protein
MVRGTYSYTNSRNAHEYLFVHRNHLQFAASVQHSAVLECLSYLRLVDFVIDIRWNTPGIHELFS